MSKPFVKLDAQETIFLEKEIEQVKTKVYEKKYPEFKARRLIPTNSDTNPGADTISYEQYDEAGVAKLVESYAKDFPRVDVKKQKFSINVKSLGDSYGYNVQEVRSAQMAGTALEQRRANAARRAMLIKEEKIAFVGIPEAGLNGLFTHPNVPEVTILADGTGASKKWNTKTPDQILRDLFALTLNPMKLTNEIENADTLVLPLDQMTYLATTRMSSNSDTTILEYFKMKSPNITSIETSLFLKGLGAGASDRAFCYKKDPDAVSLEIPKDFEQFPAQEEALDFVVYCHERIAGVLFVAPFSASFCDGI